MFPRTGNETGSCNGIDGNADDGLTALLTVTRVGSGTVGSSPTGINCGSDCTQSYSCGTSVNLTATPGASSTFQGWSGACGGTATTCSVTMNANRNVTATFATFYTLTVNKSGAGQGAIASSPTGINCGTSCSSDSETYAAGTMVTLTASASIGSVFAGWSGGGCTGAGACVVTMSSVRTVTAQFDRPTPATVTADARRGNLNSAARFRIRCASTGAERIVETSGDSTDIGNISCPVGSRVDICCGNGSATCGGTFAAPNTARSIDTYEQIGLTGHSCSSMTRDLYQCSGTMGTGSATIFCDFTD